ncbi:MAG: hypothetical protein IT508_04875 [Burkholderiaceae bacterium]|nr:hypothetical protein [Burkholderiaceae bacterium]
METMHTERTEGPANDVFSLATLLDSSAAVAAAKRLYAQNRNGVRFFCENRRLVPVQDIEELPEDTPWPDAGDASKP